MQNLYALPRPQSSLLSICVILSTGSWRDRKWQVVARLTGEDILVSVFTLVFWLLAFFPGIQQFALLLLKYLIHDKISKNGKMTENEMFQEVSNTLVQLVILRLLKCHLCTSFVALMTWCTFQGSDHSTEQQVAGNHQNIQKCCSKSRRDECELENIVKNAGFKILQKWLCICFMTM